LYLNFSQSTVVYEESWVFMSQRAYEAMSQLWVNELVQLPKPIKIMKAKISECLGLITETRA